MTSIDEKIKELQAEKYRLEKISKEPWPKTIVVYLHGDKDSNWERGSELGLSEESIKENFRFCCYEVGIRVLVNQDGSTKILGIKD